MSELANINIKISTTNGTGAQSANEVLLKSIFNQGFFVNGKNLFPSNIAGMPSSYHIRINKKKYLSYQNKADVLVAMNPSSIAEDLKSLRENSLVIYNSDHKFFLENTNKEFFKIALPCRQLLKLIDEPFQLKKLLFNMVYIGFVGQILNLDLEIMKKNVKKKFQNKLNIFDVNLKALEKGYFYKEFQKNDFLPALNLKSWPTHKVDKKILTSGNTASALGLLYGGCTLMSWYPITPSSSLVEAFEHYACNLRKTKDKKNKFIVIQAEDELSAISIAIGGSWSGARSATVTSGPGLSLMSEAAGLSYFAEVPAVIWNVQRAGPSTGLPTRTMQADILSAAFLSHGDTEHIVLIPSSLNECFEFGQMCFDLAEELQTLVIVLSDLDLGMNLFSSNDLKFIDKPYRRGKILTKEDLEKTEFSRYKDIDGDGVCYRTLPGTEHDNAAYFTRGTGHDENTNYSESPKDFEKKLDRLKLKTTKAKKHLPLPYIDKNPSYDIALIAYGSTDLAIQEARDLLQKQKIFTNYLRIKSLPLSEKVGSFIKDHSTVYIIEQNRDGQMKFLIDKEFSVPAKKLHSITQYNGLPIEAQTIVDKINKALI